MPTKPIVINFWGVRGSIPTPGPQTVKYGGNTPCVELKFGGEDTFLCDAGTGIRQFGLFFKSKSEKKTFHIFISHYHWDHIQGLPFLSLLRNKNYTVNIYGCEEPDHKLESILSNQMESTYFPVNFSDFEAKINFIPISQGKYLIGEVEINTFFVNHPGYALGYRFDSSGKSIVYISDNEPFALPEEEDNLINDDTSMTAFDNLIENKNLQLVEHVKNANILIHDAQFFPAEYNMHKLWGHSSFIYPIQIAKLAQVEHVILFHHDPNHDDTILDRLYIEAKNYAKSINYGGKVSIAKEMDSYTL
ncbi:MAG: MBL fold metallo-hydrolase [Calditrichia bacterium]